MTSKKLIGVKVNGSELEVVLLSKATTGDFTVEDQTTMKLQAGERPEAYAVIFNSFADYVRQSKAECVCVKGSAVSQNRPTLSHFEAAELRGVIQAAGSSTGVEIRITSKGATSRKLINAGKRKVDEYLKDDSFWSDIGLTGLKKGHREAAFSVVHEFGK